MVRIVSMGELKGLMAKGGFVLLDIREKDELAYGSLPGAISLPLSEFVIAFRMAPAPFKKMYGFDLDKKVLMVLYCRTGARSDRACGLLESQGFNVADYSGGVKEWSTQDKNVRFY